MAKVCGPRGAASTQQGVGGAWTTLWFATSDTQHSRLDAYAHTLSAEISERLEPAL